ncbi:hypothetical protein MKW98_013859 [Papaver atlanticum]|uniref:Uncharacterized protein n=1 Tax=Papaver atlanticum TaxID=357466 RepID=A0AAD4T947_9MAGN|nr:hypothetical protein MKW98_013859 [Papaver atlanticum]
MFAGLTSELVFLQVLETSASLFMNSNQTLGMSKDVSLKSSESLRQERFGSCYSVSYSSGFLDMFKYAISTKIEVLNLCLGGPNYSALLFLRIFKENNISRI